MYEDFDECDDPHCLACIDHQAAMLTDEEWYPFAEALGIETEPAPPRAVDAWRFGRLGG